MTTPSALTRDHVRDTYDKQARRYDLAVWLYRFAGMRIGHWRRMVIDALELKPGDTVVEIGCGTGLNFSLLEERIGAGGKIIGVDISETMLDYARQRVRAAGWQNVKLIRSAAADFRFPDAVEGILAVGVLTYEPDFDQVIKRGAEALAPGAKWAVLDYKMPKGWLRLLAPLFIALGSSFAVSKEGMDRHIWEAVERHLGKTSMRELYGGFVYLVVGAAA